MNFGAVESQMGCDETSRAGEPSSDRWDVEDEIRHERDGLVHVMKSMKRKGIAGGCVETEN